MSIRKSKTTELIFFVEFYVYMIVYTLQTSAFNEFIPNIVYTVTRYFVVVTTLSILFCKPFRIKKNMNSLIVCLCVVFSIGNYLTTGFAIPLEIICLIISAEGIDFEWIVKNYIRITMSVMIIAFVFSCLGIIPTNNVIQNGVERYAFGMLYCTDFAAHIFYLILADNYMNFKKISFGRIGLYLVSAFIIYKYCFAKLDTLLILILVALDLYLIVNALVKNRKNEEYKGSIFVRALLILAFPLCALLSVVCAVKFNESIILKGLDALLNFRLYYSSKAIDLYGFPLWGEFVQMVGSGTIAKNPNAGLQYFYVDNSFLFIMLRYGVLFLCGLGVLTVSYINTRIRENDWILPLMLALTLISSIIDHHFFSIYNVFLFGYIAFIKQWEEQIIPRKIFHIGRNGVYIRKI